MGTHQELLGNSGRLLWLSSTSHTHLHRQSGLHSDGNCFVFSERQKHIPIRICHLKECRREGMIELRPISTKFQLADIGTKALPAPVFQLLHQPLRDTILCKISFRKLQGF